MPADVSMSIALRPATGDDLPFLYRVYAGTRLEELSAVNWTDEQREAFLRMQFDAQHRYYHEQYSRAAYDVILADDVPAGRLYLDRRDDEFRIIDIALLPAYRGKGIGGRLMADILGEAAAAGKPVRIHVEHMNRAMSLYRRLGFVPVHDQGIYVLMERPAAGGTVEGNDAARGEYSRAPGV